ncbi:unnamed protein product [Larinioides sclopetarius]|uniref:DH domain-containing protein n=2 Tax=Larinioides sclopetarius TaxID=280406 RepID=A0AAV1ZMY0_9ARAC
MTSEASPRLPSPAPAPVSVKALAQEIEARSGTPGKGFIPKSSPPVAPSARTLQQHIGSQESTTSSSLSASPLRNITDYLSPGPSRRCSEGDIFLRCKPRPPPVAPKQRRVSLEQGSLPAVPERRTTLSRVLENSHLAPASVCQTENTSKFASFTNAVESGVTCRAEAADDFSPAIFSRSLPASSATTKQLQSPLDDIITSLEKICDEFTLPEKVSKRPERVGRRYSTADSYLDSSSYQRGNDDVFEKKQITSNASQQTSGNCRILNHSRQCPCEHAGSQDGLGTRDNPLKPSEYEFLKSTFDYVNPTFVQDDDEESEPVIYRSTLQFTPKPPDRHAVSATLQVSSPKRSPPYRVERSASSCSNNHSAGFYQNFQSKDSSDNNAIWRKSGDVQTTILDRSPGDLQIQTVRSDQRQALNKDDKQRDEACPTSDSDPKLRKPVVASKPELPKVLTSSLVSQNTESLRVKGKKAHDGARRDSSPSEELEIVKNILANLDFDKYKRRASLETDRRASDMEEKSPKPPRAQKSSSAKFKDLLDLLKPSSDCPKDSNKRPFGLCRSSSFSNTEENTFMEDREKSEELPEAPKMSTLPRGKSKTKHQPVMDTRTHVVYEILETEKSYVDSLQTLVTKYMGALKSTDYNGVVEGGIVDEIFFQIPEILSIHEEFLEGLQQRCSNWDVKYTVGDLFVEAFTKQQVIDTYTAFINNWKCAKDATKIATQAKPAFARFLEHMSREHKGKLALDALLIMPVQRIPRYELLIKELLKHTNMDHPDHHLLVQAQKEVHDLAVKINRVEREAFQIEQMQQRVREIEQHIEGVVDLCMPDRAFIRHDVVTIPGGLGTKKERCLFLFSDILLITSIKRKSTAMRKPSSTPSPSPSQSPFTVLDSNKYKLLTRFSLESMEISKSTDVSLKKAMRDIATLEEDIHILNQIKELVGKLSSPHQALEDVVRDLTNGVSKQMLEKQNSDYSLISLELTVTTQERVDNLTIQFTSPERRAVWSAAFNEAKQKLAVSTGRRLPPELKKAMPIRKTRAGLQFTCAAATLGCNQQGLREVWVCNSDGYVGQVCVLSLLPEPTVMSCNGVCNARILTIAAIPAACTMISDKSRWRAPVTEAAGVSIEVEEVVEESSEELANNGNIQLDSDSSDDDDDSELPDDEKGKDENRKRGNSIPREEGQDDMDHKQPTMWLGTEDGCVHVYHSSDNIRTKKNKIKIQHSAAIQCIIYLDNRVFVSIANGEVHIYRKESDGGWSTSDPQKVTIGSSSAPVTIMLAVAGKLWCGCQNFIHVLNTSSLLIEHSFAVSSDTTRYVLCMVTSGLGVWVTVTPSAVVRLFHATSYEPLLDVNVAPTVAKILSAATDDIIKQHKSACLRVTAMLACKDLLWIGTSAGVILTLPLPHLTSTTLNVDVIPTVTGLPHGHTGHVRFLTCVEAMPGVSMDPAGYNKYSFRSTKPKENTSGRRASTSAASTASNKLLVISGGDGYEDFSSSSGLGEQAGHDDSTNHLLLWHV